jgi:hypothetical protein
MSVPSLLLLMLPAVGLKLADWRESGVLRPPSPADHDPAAAVRPAADMRAADAAVPRARQCGLATGRGLLLAGFALERAEPARPVAAWRPLSRRRPDARINSAAPAASAVRHAAAEGIGTVFGHHRFGADDAPSAAPPTRPRRCRPAGASQAYAATGTWQLPSSARFIARSASVQRRVGA